MKKLFSLQVLGAAAVAAFSTFSSPAAFAQATFTPGTGTSANCDLGANGASADSKSCSQSGVNVDLTAWGYFGVLDATPSGTFTQGRLADFNTNGVGGATGFYETGGNGQHAFDNLTSGCGTTAGTYSVANSGNGAANSGCGGSIEGLLLSFTSGKVSLSNIGIGYNGGDADLSVWAYTGNSFNLGATNVTGCPNASGAACGVGGTTSAAMSGWTLVSNNDFGSGTGSQGTGSLGNGSTAIYSSYFMITTYFGAASGGLNAGNDGFKLSTFTANVCTQTLTGGTTGGTGAANNGNGATCGPSGSTGVPEPTSLALVGVALLGGVAASRRRAR